MPLTDLQVREHPVYGILSQLSSIKDIKVSVGKELWPGEKNLPDIVLGTVNQWVHKERMQIKITWTEADGSMAHDSEDLHILLLPHVNFKLLKGSKGEALLLRGQARAEHQARVPKKTVSIPYTVGAVTRQQVWTIEDDPEAIRTDARTEPRSKPQLARRRDDIKTPFDCWYNAAVSHKMFDKMELAFNQRLDGKSYETRKTSRGELVRFVGMMGALALQPGLPLSKMWKRVKGAKDIFPPAAMGQYGTGIDRFKLLKKLAGEIYPLNGVGALHAKVLSGPPTSPSAH